MNLIRVLATSFLLVTAGGVALAIPARREWRQVALPDGSTETCMTFGDERGFRYVTRDGRVYDMTPRNRIEKRGIESLRTPGKRFEGEKRGLFILAEFDDVRFSRDDIKDVYERILNERGYSEGPFKGSVRDYFHEQSAGRFDLSFDIVGPVTLSGSEASYGSHSMSGYDCNIEGFVSETCALAAPSVDFSKYDWDGDGEADQVFILYAGYGEAQHGPAWTLWPCEGKLSKMLYGDCPVFNGVKINTFAIGCELHGNEGTQIDGIGTICHEFSHCLGLPDCYNTLDISDFCMDAWDLMDYGAYNGDSYEPAGFTAMEKMTCGWIEPEELETPRTDCSMRPLSEGGGAFLIRNDGWHDEYYLLEYRGDTGFDASLPAHGILVTHIDYDREAWISNKVNAGKRKRMSVVSADCIYDKKTVSTDIYPFVYLNGQMTLDSLTNETFPAAKVFNANTDGSRYLNKPVYNMKVNGDGTASFDFMTHSGSSETGVTAVETCDAVPVEYISLSGCRIQPMGRECLDDGIYIVRYSDGSVRKERLHK